MLKDGYGHLSRTTFWGKFGWKTHSHMRLRLFGTFDVRDKSLNFKSILLENTHSFVSHTNSMGSGNSNYCMMFYLLSETETGKY